MNPPVEGVSLRALCRSLEPRSEHALLWCLFLGSLLSSVGPLPAAEKGSKGGYSFTNAIQVLELKREDTVQNPSARLRGVVTYTDQVWNSLFIQDTTAGISVTRPTNGIPLEVGMEVEIEGEARLAEFAPTLVASSIKILGREALPTSEIHSIDQLIGGRSDSQWIQMEGIVSGVSVNGGHLFLDFSTTATLQAILPGYSNSLRPEILELVDARVRLTGVCGTRFSDQGNLVSHTLFVAGREYIEVTEPRPAAPFDLPLTPIAAPLSYENAKRFGHRVRVSGIFIGRYSSKEFFMQDESGGATFLTQEPIAFTPGDRLEVAAFPKPGGATPTMHAALVRRIGSGSLPQPRVLTATGPILSKWDCTLGSAEGELKEVLRSPHDTKLILQNGTRRFSVQLADPSLEKAAVGALPGAWLSITGVCNIQLDDHAVARDLTLYVSSSRDIQVLTPPPWWTAKRAVTFLGAALLLLIAWRTHGLWQEARLKEQYRLIFDHATELISTHDLEGRFTTVNGAWTRSTGFSSKILLEKNWTELLPTDQATEWKPWWRQVITGQTPHPKEVKITSGDGKEIWLEAVCLLVKDGRGRVTVQSIARDVSDRHREEQMRSQLEGRLRQSEKMEALGTLTGGIAHDFNNILASLLGNAELLKLDLPPQIELQTSLAGITQGVKRASGLVQQLLAFSKGEHAERRPLRLGPTIADALTLIRASLPATIEIHTEFCSTDLQVIANTTQIHQVLMNLCYNASHAIGHKPGRIEIRESVLELDTAAALTLPPLKAGTYLLVRVSDTGSGMDSQTLERIFEPFFTTKGPGGGTGLGLAVVHGIMASNLGLVTATSSPGCGCTFHLYFPAKNAETVDTSTIVVDLPQGRGQRILLVDDEEAVLRLASRFLTRLNYSVTPLADPSQALALFTASPTAFDLLISDLTMPKMTGVDLANEMRAVKPGLPILLCTGHRKTQDLISMDCGEVYPILSKPYPIETLAQAIHSALNPKHP